MVSFSKNVLIPADFISTGVGMIPHNGFLRKSLGFFF